MSDKRGAERIKFDHGVSVSMMAVDGTWRRPCVMEDVSDTGAKLTIEGPVEKLALREFFLMLSPTGVAYRRCKLVWVKGGKIGVSFIKQAR